MIRIFQFLFYLLLFALEVILYNQSDYVLYFERVEVVRFDKEYMQDIKTVNFKYNRTVASTNYSGILKKDLGNNIKIEVQAFKWASNEYRLFPMTFQFGFCNAVSKNDYGLQNLYRCGNFPKCPIKKGTYHFCNFIPDESKFPPYIPSGSYRIDLKFMHLSVEFQYLQLYISITRPVNIPA